MFSCPCGFRIEQPVYPIYCRCGTTYTADGPVTATAGQEPPKPLDENAEARKAICKTCRFRTEKGCALYLRPCSIKRMWADEIEPPEACPHKEALEAAG